MRLEQANQLVCVYLYRFASFAGSFTPFRSVQIFCAYTGTAVVFVYFYMILFTMGALALSGRQEEKGRNLITCKLKPDHNADVPADGEVHPYSNRFLGTYFSDFLNNRFIKVCVVLAYLAMLAFAVLGILRLEEGLEPKNLTPDDSYYRPFVALDDQYFSKYGPYVQVSLNERLDYTDASVQRKIEQLIDRFKQSKYFSSDDRSVVFWLDALKNFRQSTLGSSEFANMTELIAFFKTQFVTLDSARAFRLDVKTDAANKHIERSRFFVQTVNQFDSLAQQEMMKDARRIRDEAPYDVTVFTPLFLFIDQYVVTSSQTLMNLGIAVACMFVVSMIFIPSWCTTFLVTLSTISICVFTVGYMSWWGVRLDAISMINLIMCIGFSVDFSAHVSFHYISHSSLNPDDRVRDAMMFLGTPVIQSALSTIMGLMLMATSTSFIMRTFYKVILLVIVFGFMHAMFLLPVLLSTCTCHTADDISALTLNMTEAGQLAQEKAPEKGEAGGQEGEQPEQTPADEAVLDPPLQDGGDNQTKAAAEQMPETENVEKEEKAEQETEV